jgi:hypothetical protein
MSNQTDRAPADGYRRFLAAAQEAEAIIQSHPEADDSSVAECYRYLAGMWIFHLERAFKSYDAYYPCFIRDMDSFRTWGLPTPDHHYYSAQIEGGARYKISGNRGNVVDLSFEILTGLVGDDGKVGERISALEEKHIVCDADGNFEVIVGGPGRQQNWLSSADHARCVFVRQTVDDWENSRPAPMIIERLDNSPQGSFNQRMQSADVAAQFDQAARNMINQVRFLNAFCLEWQKVLPVNSLAPPAVGPADAGYFPGQFNTKCQFAVEQDQALLITLPPSSAKYESLSLAHPHWFNGISPRLVQSSLNRRQAQMSPDGNYRYVISAKDPGVPNWLNTAGLLRGFLFIRYQQADPQNPPPQPNIELLSLNELGRRFSKELSGEYKINRSADQNKRRLGMDKRYF